MNNWAGKQIRSSGSEEFPSKSDSTTARVPISFQPRTIVPCSQSGCCWESFVKSHAIRNILTVDHLDWSLGKRLSPYTFSFDPPILARHHSVNSQDFQRNEESSLEFSELPPQQFHTTNQKLKQNGTSGGSRARHRSAKEQITLEEMMDAKVEDFPVPLRRRKSSPSSSSSSSGSSDSPFRGRSFTLPSQEGDLQCPTFLLDTESLYQKKTQLKNVSTNKIETEPSVLNTVLVLLDKRDLTVAHIDILTEFEMFVFRSLVKKLYGQSTVDQPDLPSLVEKINKARFKSKPKRLEEELKVVFKKTIKFLMTKIKDKMVCESQTTLKKKNFVLGFFNYYFEEVSANSTQFRSYFRIFDKEGKLDYPKLNSQLIHPLTVNANHLAHVILSTRFKNDVLEYVNNHFVEEYKDARYSKIKRVLINVYDLARKSKSLKEIEEAIINHQMKLPWSTQDLEHALQTFRSLTEKSPGASAIQQLSPMPQTSVHTTFSKATKQPNIQHKYEIESDNDSDDDSY